MRVLVLLLPFLFASIPAQPELTVTVVDENRIPVSAALLTLVNAQTGDVVKGETDSFGRFAFRRPAPETDFQIRAEKKGFYPAVLKSGELPEAAPNLTEVEMVLTHQQELSEQVEVVSSPARMDPKETAAGGQISNVEILNVPFTATRDIRNALPLISGAVQDHSGRIHVDGSASSQTQVRLDGFKIDNPATGLFDTRITVDAVRSIQLRSSRFSAECGNASGGVFDLTSASGDDHFRFSTTDFLPSFQSRRGLHLNNWTPRMTFAGPIVKGKAWFHQALDGEYGLDIIEELPAGEDTNQTWRVGGLTKAQVNLGRSHVLTGIWLFNQFRSDHAGLNPYNPVEASVDERHSAYVAGLRSQSYWPNGWLVEIALGMNQNRDTARPMGQLPYEIHLEQTRGNYYRFASSLARRFQFAVTATLPVQQGFGRHELKWGIEADRTAWHSSAARGPIKVFNSRGRVIREVSFATTSPFALRDLQIGTFLQDRWSLSDRLLLELGSRFDWDDVLSDFYFSPRLAASYLLDEDNKLAAGVGLFHDAVRLDLLGRPLSGRRFDLAIDVPESSSPESIESFFTVAPRSLRVPRSVNWSVGWERQLRDSLVLNVQVTGKAGRHAWSFEPNPGAQAESGDQERHFRLTSRREDRYRALKLGIGGTPTSRHTISASYTCSSARSSYLLDPDIDNLVFGAPGEGPVAWDAPHRFLAWGWSTVTKRLQAGYSLEWRSGFPFSVLNQNQEVVGAANSRRFPDYFSLNLHLERRFRFANYEWALRAGFNNLTDHTNPSVVNNNIDSPGFLSFSALQDRAFVGRIRFLGKK
ncbi:MAG: TonB-dependent receptor domain-containing protein [Acidobacteriota bacterium]